jgi:toxin-antitoxin system PIN domain toxin
MIAIDTNLLVYAHRAQTPEHGRARAALEQASQQPDGWGFAGASVLEFWAVVTHPSATGRPSTPAEARAFIGALVAAGARILRPSARTDARLLAEAERLGCAGPRVFDLAIALTVVEHGATALWTHDRRFVSVPGLDIVDPLEA